MMTRCLQIVRHFHLTRHRLVPLACMLTVSIISAAERPNILWLTCEDISPYLGCYGCPASQTPNIDKLASDGNRYTHAYANAPVCAVARSTLLTGMYSSTLGTHHMRCNVQLPESTPAYPKLFREAGYYCTNNSKKDYNSNFGSDPTLWNESSGKAHYKNRKEGQPFFSVFNITVTHESQLSQKRIKDYVAKKQIPATPRIDPSDIDLPPYHPDLPEIRQDWARFHDLITLMDSMIGERLRELEELGLADNTIIFFYGDHGGQLARSKRFIYNVGTQVPLIIRFPEKWRDLATAAPGTAVDHLVSFVDFPKTVLSICGLQAPELMQGSIFLGPDREPNPPHVHFYRDRMGERTDFSRAITDGRWYLIQNFMPHRPRGRDSRYGYQVQANWGAWQRHYDAGRCNAIQSQFFEPKPVVQLFDTHGDPWHVKNLADDPTQQDRVAELQRELFQWMIDTRDAGLIPEAMFHELTGDGHAWATRYEFAQSDHYPIDQLLPIVRDCSRGDLARLPEYRQLTRHDNPIARHWGAYALFLTKESAPETQHTLQEMMSNDSMAANRVMAAQAMGVCGKPDRAFTAIMNEANAATNGYVLFHSLSAFQYAHLDGRLTKSDWSRFKKNRTNAKLAIDKHGFEYADRIINDALSIWPETRKVD